MSNVTKASCRTCHTETKHLVLATRKIEESQDLPDYGPVYWKNTYEMLECCGCETISLRNSWWFSETDETKVSFYPPAVSRRTPAWNDKLPSDLNSLMDEIYTALHADNRRLALMGARTVVDMVLSDKIGDTGTFLSKLEDLEQQGFVGLRSREFLAAALDAGNAAVHRGFEPKEEQLGHVMDIIENVLQAVYILEDSARELRKSTPPRAFKKGKQ